MRNFLFFCLLLCTLTLQAQQQKKTTATPPKKAVPAKTAPATQTKTPAKKATPAKQNAPAKQNPPAKSTPAKNSQQAKGNGTGGKTIQQLKNEQSNLQRQIKESETAIRNTQNNVKAQLANLAVLSGSISSQKEYVQSIQAEVDTLSQNITALGKDIMFLEEDLAECKKRYSHGMMYMYRTRLSQNKLMFIFSAKDFSQMYRRIRYAQEYTKYQRAQAIVLQKKEEAIRKKRDELASTSKKKTSLLKEGKQQQKELEQQQRERQAVVDDLNRKQKQLQATLAEQQRQNRLLNDRIDQLVQEEIRRAEEKRKAEEARRKAEQERQRRAEAERQRKEQEAKAEAAKNAAKGKAGGKGKKDKGKKDEKASPAATTTPTTSTPKYNAPDNTDRQLSSNFAANQGHLPVPITGSYVISAHFGPYSPEGLEGVTLDNKGTDYSGKAGAQARSVFDGEVTSVFSLGGMTNVIVRHGSYISVYCNLSSANVRVGQRVSTRQILGPIARDASGNCTLHFQLRKETAKLNPEKWIGR